jgi:hypothetical protein
MKVILLMIKEKEMENIFGKMVVIILENFWMVYFMVKERNIIRMVLLDMKVILLMIKEKEIVQYINAKINLYNKILYKWIINFNYFNIFV